MKRILPFLFLLIATMAFSRATAQQFSKAYFCNVWGSELPMGLCSTYPDYLGYVEQISEPWDFNAGEYANGYIYAFTRSHTDYNYHFNKIDLEGNKVSDILYEYYPNDMAWDDSTSTMFCVGDEYLGTVNLETGEISVVELINDTPLCCLMCYKGILYGISTTTGILYSIDKTTATLTEIGSTGQTPRFIQSAAVDPLTGICYWCYSDAQKDCIYTLDLETAEVTFLRNSAECTGLCFVVGDATEAPTLPITNLQAETEANNVTLTWDAWIGHVTSYSITRDGEPIWTCASDTTNFTENDLEDGTYEYCVTAVYENGESEPVCTTVIINIENISEETSATSIYPNPVSDKLTINVSNASRCTLSDTQGRIVGDINAKGQETVEFKTEDLPAGVYFLTIYNEKAPSTRTKVVVAK